ncbi:MAG TPA: xylulokinase [Acidimicrobiia bacterium]|nr:xylulokinase [Acidimicrobiia bacterium]
MTYVVGIDVSTTATKALLLDRSGGVLASGTAEYGYDVPRPQWTEQDPHLWWDASVAAIGEMMGRSGVEARDIDAIGLTGQMHGSVLLDEEGEVVRPAILWNDQRTARECDEIRHRVGRERLISITGNDALTGFTAPKLLWVADNEPESWARVATIMLPKDYVRYRLTGDRVVDVADGSGTILFDLASRSWSPEVLGALGIDPGMCPPTMEGPEITGALSGEAAQATGLLAGTPVVAGGGDQSANAVGVGAIDAGVVALSLGTSGVVFAASDAPSIDPEARVQAFCHAVPGRWHMMGVMLSAAGSLRWLRDAVAPGREFADLVDAAAEIPAGSEGLLFLPYLSGERTPHPDPLARGAFVGLTVSHDLRHMTRAVLEGVAFGLRDGLDLMVAAGVAKPASIRASGGGTRSELWLQILADVLDAGIEKVATEEGAAFGAGVLASIGAGHFEDPGSAVASIVEARTAAEPSGQVAAYAQAHARYRDLYPALRPTFASLAPE